MLVHEGLLDRARLPGLKVRRVSERCDALVIESRDVMAGDKRNDTGTVKDRLQRQFPGNG